MRLMRAYDADSTTKVLQSTTKCYKVLPNICLYFVLQLDASEITTYHDLINEIIFWLKV